MGTKRNIWKHIFAILIAIAYEQGAVILFIGKIGLPELLYYLVAIPFFYLCAIILFPLKEKKNISGIRLLLTVLVFIIGFFLSEVFIAITIQYVKGEMVIIPKNINFYKKTFLRCIYIMALSYAYYQALLGIRKAKEAGQRELQLVEQERNHAELENAFLRSQINPHLLFNTLQFIQYQVEKGSDKAARAVQLLGEVMHYSLDATARSNTVPLGEEIAYIEQYVELARLRSDNSLYLDLKIKMDEAARYLQLPPGIIGNFIENIFKHGDLTERDAPAIAYIYVNGRDFFMHVSNLKQDQSAYRKTGIGMANVRKRLELLYPGRYSLKEEEEENNHYKLYLEIEL